MHESEISLRKWSGGTAQLRTLDEPIVRSEDAYRFPSSVKSIS